MGDKPTTGEPGPLVPDRNAVPPTDVAVTRDPSEMAPHKDTNDPEGLTSPEVEAKAPGRSTHGATNNP